MTQEEYKARRKELQDKMGEARKQESIEIQKNEDDRHLAHRNAADKIKEFVQMVENEKMTTIRHLRSAAADIRAKYATMRSGIDTELRLLDVEYRRQYCDDLKEGGTHAQE